MFEKTSQMILNNTKHGFVFDLTNNLGKYDYIV